MCFPVILYCLVIQYDPGPGTALCPPTRINGTPEARTATVRSKNRTEQASATTDTAWKKRLRLKWIAKQLAARKMTSPVWSLPTGCVERYQISHQLMWAGIQITWSSGSAWLLWPAWSNAVLDFISKRAPPFFTIKLARAHFKYQAWLVSDESDWER